ncbi:hypothetical protein [Photobacterium sanguinicancri]|uniref:hypothetical protein n=1 Tax=Photobacterium sanguinicancri TaxID=875932 RepID=UPI0026E27A5E|nr:hypothetical protein [Photobacterium sanguinicancri]MDO6498051.1 hypothetical protein [Photobacterium sanguinicancri]
MRYIAILLILISSNLYAFTIDGNENDWNTSNSINIKTENDDFNYRIANDTNNVYILIKKKQSELIPIHNDGNIFFIPGNEEFYVFISAENEQSMPTIGLKNDSALLKVSSQPWAYSYNSGLYTHSGGSGFIVKNGAKFIEIRYPKHLLQASNKKLRVTIGSSIACNLNNKSTTQQESQLKIIPVPGSGIDYSGAVAQSIVDEQLAGGQVHISGYASVSYDFGGPLSGTVHGFYSDKEGFTVHVSANGSIGPNSKPPSKPTFNLPNLLSPASIAVGIAIHSGTTDVFQDLGTGVAGGYLGLEFTVDNNRKITTKGMLMYVTTQRIPSISGAIQTEIYDGLFGDTFWSGLQQSIDEEVTGLPSSSLHVKNGVATYNNQSSSSGSDRDDNNHNRPSTGCVNCQTDLLTGITTDLDFPNDPVNAGTTDDDNDSSWW